MSTKLENECTYLECRILQIKKMAQEFENED